PARWAGADERPENLAYSATASAADDDDDAQPGTLRAEFIAALRRAEEGGDVGPDADRLRAYPLYPYLEAARITRALATAGGTDADADAEAREFLARHGEEPVARQVRRARLDGLARRADWTTFLAEA